MANAYHNLEGWIRDVRRSLDEGAERAYIVAELIQELDDLIIAPDAGVCDADDASFEEPDDGLGVPDPGDSAPVGRPVAGHATSGQLPLGEHGGLGAEVVRRGHARATQLARASLPRNRAPVGGARTVRAVGSGS